MTNELPDYLKQTLEMRELEYSGPIVDPNDNEEGYAGVYLTKPKNQPEGSEVFQVVKEMPLGESLMDICYERLTKVMAELDDSQENIFLPSKLEEIVVDSNKTAKKVAILTSDYVPFSTDDLKENNTVPLEIACRIASDIAKALVSTHEQGFVHCDVKSSNVFISAEGIAKLADYDCALPTGTREGEDGKVVFTMSHFDPKLLKDSVEEKGYTVDPSQDIYALGCVVYKMLENRYPDERIRDENSMSEMFFKKLEEVPSNLDYKFPGEIQHMVRECVSPDPDCRPSAQEMVDVFEKYATSREEVIKMLHRDKYQDKKGESLATDLTPIMPIYSPKTKEVQI